MLNFHLNEDQTVTLYQGMQHVLTYHYNQDKYKSYFHPVHTMQGHTLTIDQPYDHPWHHGLYFTWKMVDGINFWEDQGLAEQTGRTVTVDSPHVILQRGRCTIEQTLHWEKVSDGEQLLKEQRRIIVHAAHSPSAYRIDWESTFTNSTNRALLFDRTDPAVFSWGGYAGFSYRAVRSLRGGKIMNASTGVDVATTHGIPASWCDYSGPLEGGVNRHGGLTIFQHPKNLRSLSAFYVADHPELQFLNAAFLYDQPMTLMSGQQFRLRYGAYVHDDVLTKEQIEQAYATYMHETMDAAE
jgi:hypothetical protein